LNSSSNNLSVYLTHSILKSDHYSPLAINPNWFRSCPKTKWFGWNMDASGAGFAANLLARPAPRTRIACAANPHP
jgi:hypothetical protein